jgi:hypothetical protein
MVPVRLAHSINYRDHCIHLLTRKLEKSGANLGVSTVRQKLTPQMMMVVIRNDWFQFQLSKRIDLVLRHSYAVNPSVLRRFEQPQPQTKRQILVV